MFSARLRLDGSVSEAQVREYVDEVIGIVELQPVAAGAWLGGAADHEGCCGGPPRPNWSVR
jgi:hypothetical protein